MLSWMVSRRVGQSDQILTWGAYNEAKCTVIQPITAAAMLPILRAPADEYSTITTVINELSAVSRYLNQTHSGYCWPTTVQQRRGDSAANPEEFGHVIFQLGGLHVTFHFLCAIGQHIKASDLEDAWTETGLYIPNSSQNVLEGKAYYQLQSC